VEPGSRAVVTTGKARHCAMMPTVFTATGSEIDLCLAQHDGRSETPEDDRQHEIGQYSPHCELVI
jgi:hypothetical protein